MAGARKIFIDTDTLANVANEMGDCIAEMTKLLDDMDKDITELAGSWDGNNKDHFIKTFDERREAVAKQGLRLDRFTSALQGVVKLYGTMDDEIISSTNQFLKAADTNAWNGGK